MHADSPVFTIENHHIMLILLKTLLLPPTYIIPGASKYVHYT